MDRWSGLPKPSYGELRFPIPVERCALDSCACLLTEDTKAFLFRDLQSGKLVVFCEDTARYVELSHRDRFVLVAL